MGIEREKNSHFPSPSGRGTKGEGKKSQPVTFARSLRKQSTDAEHLMWRLLRSSQLDGFKFRRQHPIEKYVLDFYCHEARLGIELDGGQHNEPDERAKDEARSEFLKRKGITVVRFWNNEVLRETEGVLEKLLSALTPALSQREKNSQFPSGRGTKGEGK